VIKSKLGEQLESWLPRLLPFLFWRELPPNVLTVIGTLVSVAAAVAFSEGRFLAGALLLGAGGFFDLVDGVVARRQGTTTRFGAFLDSTLDRLVDMAVFVGLMVHYAAAGRPGLVTLTGVALIAGVMTSYTKARAENLGPAISVGVLERGERVVLLILGGLSGWMVPVLWILAVGGGITVAQRFALAHRLLAGPEPGPAQPVQEKT
jgi:CDP-diacylglycerol--glycerol-3-phosphate 3-phosphatidyltransferase